MKSPGGAVFLDRDGTLNVDRGYLHRWEDWAWIPGAVEAIGALNGAGIPVVVVSNQAGVAKGLYTAADVDRLHAAVSADLKRAGARVDAFYFCPHADGPDGRPACPCRKPRPGLLWRAQKDLRVDLASSYLVGDKLVDVEAARAAGVRPVLVETGHGGREKSRLPPGVPVFADVRAAQDWILSRPS